MIAPSLPQYQGGDVGTYLNALVQALEQALVQSPQGRPYTISNVPTTRALNASTATASDVAKVLGTLIVDLKARSIVA